jgi:hypothetical protein
MGVGERDRLVRREAAAVVGEPLHRVPSSAGAEAAFDRKQHEVAHRDAADPAAAGGPGEHLPVVGVDGEGDPNRVAVPARDFEHIRSPAPVRGGGCDLPLVRALTTAAGTRRQQQARPLHHPVDPLMVHPRQALGLGLAVQQRGDPPIAVARPGVDQPEAPQQLGVAGLAILNGSGLDGSNCWRRADKGAY